MLVAEGASTNTGLFAALGLDLRALIFNAIAFLILVWVLAKFVYPSLSRALDAKRSEIEAANRAKREAGDVLANAKAEAAKLIKEAHGAADEVLANARAEAGELVDSATSRAEAEAKQIVSEAREQLGRDVAAAQRVLVGETARLVARASGHLIGEELDAKRDAAVIKRSLEEARR